MTMMMRVVLLLTVLSVASTRELSRFFEENHSQFDRALSEVGLEASQVHANHPAISGNRIVRTLKSAMQGGLPVSFDTDGEDAAPRVPSRSQKQPSGNIPNSLEVVSNEQPSSINGKVQSANDSSKKEESVPIEGASLPPKTNLRSPKKPLASATRNQASVPTEDDSTGMVQRQLQTDQPKPQFDFVVAGFPKCGTTTLLKAFGAHPETDMFGSEQCAIAAKAQADPLVLKKLDGTLSSMQDDDMKRSFKCPTAMYNYKSIVRMEKHSPNAKFVVGIRHPIKMIQSFYNYRVTELYERSLQEPIPDFIELLETWKEPWKGVSMLSVRFELFLQQLGKTVMSPEDLVELSKATEAGYELAVKPSNFTVFLYTVDQLEDEDENRSARLRAELQEYLGLTTPIAPFGHENKNHAVGDSGHPESIHICDPEFADIRQKLVTMGVKTAAWLRDHFLRSKDVIVANPEHFVETLETWSVDPCIDSEEQFSLLDGANVVTDPMPESLAPSTETESELVYGGVVDIMV